MDPANECAIIRFDLDVGKHGDTGTSELEVLRALQAGQADAGALAESTWNNQVAKGRADANLIRPIWTSPGYCHCNFSALSEFPEERGKLWTESLVRMSYDDPRWRPLMDQEGLKRWLRADPATLKGYDVLFAAVKRQELNRAWLLG